MAPTDNKKKAAAKKPADKSAAKPAPAKKAAAPAAKKADPKKAAPAKKQPTKVAKITKAAKAAKRVLGEAKKHRAHKIRKSVHFRRPNTLKLPKNPRYARKSVPGRFLMDQYRILKAPVTTETAMKRIEDNNTLVFYTDLKATKPQIRRAMKKMFDVKIEKVNTLITPRGNKKAFIKLTADYDALDIANKIGII